MAKIRLLPRKADLAAGGRPLCPNELCQVNTDMNDFLTLGPPVSKTHLLLAHGAGAPMTSPFMEVMSQRLAAHGIAVHRFEFPYMGQRRTGGSRRPPPKAEILTDAFKATITVWAAHHARPTRLVIGGKSLGGRVASLIADDLFATGSIAGVVCLGYPFHPPRKPDALRTAHLESLKCPALIVQGTRDPFGTRKDVESYQLANSIAFHWVQDGDHDLKPRPASGIGADQALDGAAEAIAQFIRVVSR